MDYLQSPYCRYNKILLSFLGEWPYLSSRQIILRRTFLIVLFISFIVPKIINIFQVWGDLDLTVNCIPIFLLDVINIFKLTNNIGNAKKLRQLFDLIQQDWKFNFQKEEFEIIKNHGEFGRKLTILYMSAMYFTTIIYLSMPIIPIILDILVPLNETRPLVYLIEAEYFVDRKKYYIPMLIHGSMSCTVAVSILIAVDTEYFVQVLHGCGLLAVVNHRFQKLNPQVSVNNNGNKIDKTYGKIVDCIVEHKKALQYVKLLESSRTVLFFFSIGINIVAISITGFQTVMKLDQPAEACRFAIYTMSQITHIFFNSYPAQIIMNNSENLNNSIYSGKWYNASKKSQKLIAIIMARGQYTSKITAGKIYVMSMESFSTVIKTSMSYFTMLSSFR